MTAKPKRRNRVYKDMMPFASDFLFSTYGITTCPSIEISNKLNDCLAKLEPCEDSDGTPTVRIVISSRVVDYYTMKEQTDIIKHELIHFALAFQNRGFKDGDLDFEQELNKLKVPHQNEVQLRGKVYIYSCDYQHEEVELHRTVKRTNVDLRICPICKHPMKYKGTYLITKESRKQID